MKWKPPETLFTCGAAAIRNCLIFFDDGGSSEIFIREISNTTKNGVNEKGIRKAFKYFGYETREISSTSPDVFGRKILKSLKSGKACIVLSDHCNHWIFAAEYKHRKIKIVDDMFKHDCNRKIEQELTLKELKTLASNFDRTVKKPIFYFIEVWK